MVRLLSLFALAATSVLAYDDASPYILASSTRALKGAPASHPGIQPMSTYVQLARDHLSTCSSDAYIIVSQPALQAGDLARRGVYLKDQLKSLNTENYWVAENVIPGAEQTGYDMEGAVQMLMKGAEEWCGAQVDGVIDAKTGSFKIFDDMRPKVVRVEFETLPESREARAKMVAQNDAFLHSVIEMLPTKKWSLFYLSSSSSEAATAAEVKEGAVEASKSIDEDIVSELRRRTPFEDDDDDMPAENSTQTGGLFEKYQFFTPAIFMAYIAFFFMAMILYVGLSALSGLEVSYGSFEKENGPAAQKKQ